MDSLLYLTLLASIFFISTSYGQNCQYPTLADVNRVADESLDALSLSNTNTIVYNYSISCLSVGTQRDKFRLATAVVIFTTNSGSLQGAGCPANTECIGYLEMVCNENTNVWGRNQIFVTETFTVDPNAPMNITRTDCGSCGIERSVPKNANATFDPQTHCFDCGKVCFIRGLSLCIALTDDSCCNYYKNNVCVADCGQRFVPSMSQNYTCICNNSFTGPNCDVCNLQCTNGVRNQYCMCDCSPGFTGTTCDVNINDCTNDTCQNGGTCTDLVNDYRCNCSNGFEGRNCETNINDCVNVTCSGNGQCKDLIGGFECNCSAGYTGKTCNETINNCLQNPCQNGGTCINRIANYTCNCTNNFSGRNCTECNSPFILRNGRCLTTCEAIMPCQNGGTCEDLVNGYRCNCSNGFEGRNCETNINDCANVTCSGNGQCKDLIGGFECNCSAGYTGKTCNETINNCLQNPCQNGGTCINRIANYTCNCTNNFSGQNCTECNSPFILRNGRCLTTCEAIMPCQNGGICNNLPNGSYFCVCPNGFSGINCTRPVRPNPCQPNPCLNGGSCQVTGTGEQSCLCRPNFSGEKCETCAIKNCLNCSLTTNNICDKCVGGYVPTNSSKGGCASDLFNCSRSSNVPLCKWQHIASSCSLIDTQCRKHSPKSKYSLYSSYLRNYTCYEDLFRKWKRRAYGVISGSADATSLNDDHAIGMRHNTEKELVRRWRGSLRKALRVLSDWVVYYKRTVPGSNVPPLPHIDTGSQDIKALYNQYIQYWTQLVTIFNNEVVPNCCSNK